MNLKLGITLAVAVLAVFLLGTANAQNERTKTFPLNQPFPDQVAACLEKADAEDVINADQKGDEAVLMAVITDKTLGRKCGLVQGLITYKRLALRLLAKDGTPLSVYEAVLGGKTIYVPMKFWRHEEA